MNKQQNQLGPLGIGCGIWIGIMAVIATPFLMMAGCTGCLVIMGLSNMDDVPRELERSTNNFETRSAPSPPQREYEMPREAPAETVRVPDIEVTEPIAEPAPAVPSREDIDSSRKPSRPIREWTSAAGTTIEARLVSMAGKKVKLESNDGRQVTVDAGELSQEDQEYLNSLKKPNLRIPGTP